jgi:hypothetical protein
VSGFDAASKAVDVIVREETSDLQYPVALRSAKEALSLENSLRPTFGAPTRGIFSMGCGLQMAVDCETLQLDEKGCPVSTDITVQSAHMPPLLSLTEKQVSQPNSRDVSFSGMQRLRVQAWVLAADGRLAHG